MTVYFSNGTEFAAWMHNWCDRCSRDAFADQGRGCPLLTKLFTEDDPEIPQFMKQGPPFVLGDTVHCIDFKPKGFRGGKEPFPKPDPPGQENLFDPRFDRAPVESKPCAEHEQVSRA